MNQLWESFGKHLKTNLNIKKEVLGTPTLLGIVSLLGVHLFIFYLEYAFLNSFKNNQHILRHFLCFSYKFTTIVSPG